MQQDRDRASVARRIAEEVARLREMALADGLGMLAFLLANAIAEAEMQAKKKDN